MVATGEGVSGVDGGVASLAQKGIIGSAVPAGTPTEAAVAGACRLGSEGAGGGALLFRVVVAHASLFFPHKPVKCYARSNAGEEKGYGLLLEISRS